MQCGLYLVEDDGTRVAMLLRGPDERGPSEEVTVEVCAADEAAAQRVVDDILQFISQACSVARTLQPSMVVIEDVDLIAEERGPRMGQHPLLFQLLNEMDGLGSDVDVTFLLTTNRADMLEEALAARPGRVDHAAELPVPDDEGRRRLIELYRGNLVLDLSEPELVVARSAGVTASFLKELLRRAALVAAERTASGGSAAPNGPLHVTDADMNAALDQLLDTRNQLTRALLGGGARHSTATP